jgi:hypothetical protein
MRGDAWPGGVSSRRRRGRGHLASNVRVAVVLLIAGLLPGHAS